MSKLATAPYTTRVDLRDLAAIVIGLSKRGLVPRSRSEAISMAVEFAAGVLVRQHGFERPETVAEAIEVLKSLKMLDDKQIRGRRSIMAALSAEDATAGSATIVNPVLVARGLEIMKELEAERK